MIYDCPDLATVIAVALFLTEVTPQVRHF